MEDLAARDAEGVVAFYVPLWKRQGISLGLFDNYWQDVHGPVCARLPGQYQYWQFHVGHAGSGTFAPVPGVRYGADEEEQFDGIAELTFRSAADRSTWFVAAGILMDDEHNPFRKAIGYVTNPGDSRTYVDRIENGAPNNDFGGVKFHAMVFRQAGVSDADFRGHLQLFAETLAGSERLLKLRLHLFQPPETSRPDAPGVSHSEPPESQFQAAVEIAWRTRPEMERCFASDLWRRATSDQARYVRQIAPYPERFAATFVYGGRMTIGGIRGARTARLITDIGAVNQLRDNILALLAVEQRGLTVE